MQELSLYDTAIAAVPKPLVPVTSLPAGISLVPYLQPHRSVKKGGHPVVIRITACKKHLYLKTNLYAEKKGFNQRKKVLTNPAEQEKLDKFISAAVTLCCEFGKNLASIRELWVWMQVDIKVEKQTLDFYEHYKNHRLDELLSEREQLESQLQDINARIDELSKNLKRSTPREKASEADKQAFKKAILSFKATWQLLKKRDQQAWGSWLTILEECANVNKLPLTLGLFDLEFYAKYAQHILYTRNNFDNTFGAHVKRLKAFLKFSETHGYQVNPCYKDKKFKIWEEVKEVIYLDDYEMNALWDFKEIMPQYSKVIDLATIQNLCGFRVSDLMKKHLISKDRTGHEFLRGICKKNKGEYNIPLTLDKRIKSILETYKYDLSILSEAQYNKQLKIVVGKMYEYQGTNIQVEIRPTKLGVACPYPANKQDELSSHSMRRSFCTRHINGSHFNQNDILKMLGSKDLSELQKYMKTETTTLVAKAQAASAASVM